MILTIFWTFEPIIDKKCAVIYQATILLDLFLPTFRAFLYFRDCEHFRAFLPT
ncbi:hypothetical protein HYC85_007940 [Camellia sinensis]|uniref:Uncharacterized protein n=1 Tax=Camellia sinensis TaxID=4442 RepID=A0A7J7HSQ8_CAMSI|nr:hypothetical protein HYC85_007940 [Camellia sinensis]